MPTRNTKHLQYFLLLTACLIALSTTTTWGQIEEGLTFYASFDQGIQPDNCAGALASTGEYQSEPGIAGPALLASQDGIRYICAGNFTREYGTLSFWVKPSAQLGQKDENLFRTRYFQLTAIEEHQVIYFMTGHTPPELDYQWEYTTYTPVSTVPQNQWTHIVLTWDNRRNNTNGPNLTEDSEILTQKRIYINGEMVAATEIAKIDGTTEDSFTIGQGIPGLYDELIIWNRAFSSEEVAQLYNAPQETAETLHALPPMVQEKQWLVYPELVYHNFSDSLIDVGQPIAIDVPLVNRTETTQSGQLQLQLLDIWEQPQGEPLTIDFTLEADERQLFPASFTSPKTGMFKVEATVIVGQTTESRDITSFGCVPPGLPPKHPFFGAHVNQTPQMPEMARRLGISANRSHNMTQHTWWRDMQYECDEWTMTHKRFYDALEAIEMDQMGQWFAAPHWAVTLPDGSHPERVDRFAYPRGWMPTDMEAFRNYVIESLRRFPEIDEWEIWNEPWCSFFFQGSVGDYITLCREAYSTAKAERPDLPIYAQWNESVWGRAILAGGVLDHCDGISYHLYTSGHAAWDQEIRHIRSMREDIAEITGETDVMLTNSESGICGSTFLRGLDFEELPPVSQRHPLDFLPVAERAVQYYVTTMSEGVQRWYYYFHQPVYPSNGYYTWSTVDITRSPRPFALALCILCWQLDGGNYVCQRELPGDLWAFFFDRNDGQSTAAVWAVNGAEVNLNCNAEAFDFMGNSIAHNGSINITTEPMYLRYNGTSEEFAALLDTAEVEIIKEAVQPEVVQAPGAPAPKQMTEFSVANELGTERLIPLDLREIVNMALADDAAGNDQGGFTDEGPFNDMRDLEPGRHTWLGVPVEIIDPDENQGKAVLTMGGMTFQSGDSVSPPIPVNRQVRGLFFTHAANYAQARGTTAGSYRIRYADGSEVVIPIIIGSNIYDWWFDQQQGEDSKTVPIVASQPLSESTPYRWIRMWYWSNPKQDIEVESITMESDKGVATLVLLGITVGVW